MKKREYYIPKGAERITHKATGAEAYAFDRLGVPYAMGFRPKAVKPEWHHRFPSAERREKKIAEFFAQVASSVERTAQRRADRKAEGRGLEVGDVVRASWGYDQTNIDYWQVTALVGARMVELRPIAQHSVETAWCRGHCAPKIDTFTGPPVRKVARNGQVKMADWGKWASKVEPRTIGGVKVYESDHWTSYA